MAYSTSIPPICLVPSFDNTSPSLWIYYSTEIGSAADNAAYFTNGLALGMKVNDIVLVSASGTGAISCHGVKAVGSTTTDLYDGTAVGSTVNSD